MKTRVLVVHDDALARFALARMIEQDERFEICAETVDAPTARELLAYHDPQIVVINLELRNGTGVELVKDARKMNRIIRIIVLSQRDDALSIQRAFRAGANGYVTIENDVSEIVQALDQILAGHLYASPNATRQLLQNLASGELEPGNSELKMLSDRELQVFSLIGRGFGPSRLASELHISVKTIETHQTHIKEKLGLRSASQLSERAARWMMKCARENLRLRNRLLARKDPIAF